MSKDDHKTDLYTTLCEGWQAVAKDGYSPNHCILATKVGIETLRYFGVQAKPLPVGLAVYNAECVAWLEAGNKEPRPEKAYSLGIDPDATNDDPRLTASTRGGYMGHLVILTNQDLLIDLSLPQVNRPHKGIELGPLIVNVPQDLLSRTEWFTTITDTGCGIGYQPRLDRKTTFQNAPDWRKNYKPLVGQTTLEVVKKSDLPNGLKRNIVDNIHNLWELTP